MKKLFIITLCLLGNILTILDSCALGFNPGDYEIKIFSTIPGEGGPQEVQCRNVKNIGWKTFNNDGCELISDSSKGNIKTWELKCESKGIENMNTRSLSALRF